MQKTMMKRIMAFVLAAALMLPVTFSETSEAKKKITLNKKNVTLYVGKSVQLKVKGTKKKVTWKSSRKKVAMVSKKGKVKAKKTGTARITAKVSGKKLVCKVKVKKKSNPKKTAAASTKVPVASQTPAVTQVPSPSAATGDVTPEPVETPFVSIAPYETGTPEAPVLSADTGVYEEGFKLQMASQPGTDIYYTTDGSIPTVASTKYERGIMLTCRNNMPNVLSAAENIKKMYISGSGYDYVPLDSQVAKCTVIRAAAISQDGESSEVATRSYFIGNDVKNKYGGAAVISMVIDPDFLLNEETGIHVLGKLYDEWKETKEAKQIISKQLYHEYEGNYTQKGKDWERIADIDFIDASEEKVEFSAPVGVRLHGGASRMYGQKSFNFYLREEYGLKNLKYELIPGDVDADGKQIKKYKSFMLRNGGNDTEYTKIRDLFNQNQVADRAFGIQAARPCVLFLNGEYWGLYNLTEKYSDNSIETNYGVDKDNVVMFKEGELDEGQDGDEALYEELWSYAEKDFTDDAVYEGFCKIMDIDSFADYYATEIYIANNDWDPKKNYQLWRTKTEEPENPYGDCKWRYLLYDTEFSMGLYGSTNASTNSMSEAVKDDALFAAVMKNKSFQQKFLLTIREIGSVNFAPDICKEKLDEYTALYQPLMQDFYTRFYGETTWLRSQFESNVDTMKNFVKGRYSKIIKYVETWCEENE